MKISTCYAVTLKSQMKCIRPGKQKSPDAFVGEGRVSGLLLRLTARECLDAYRMCLDIFLENWNEIRQYPVSGKSGMNRKRFCDILIHSTKNITARYPQFDRLHGHMPAYMRRAIIADAIGAVSAYVSNHEAWEKSDRKESEPVMGCPDRYELTFYNRERETSLLDHGIIGVKLYDGNEWNWHYFRISMTDARYISHLCRERKMLSPVIERKNRKWQIRFCFSEKRKLTSKKPLESRILAVDLGILNSASWCVMESDGTVRARGVISLAREEDRLRHLMNRSRMYQQAGKKSHKIYRMMAAANRQLSIDTARALIEKVEEYNVDCIVFEHLDRTGRKRGRTAQRIHMWRCLDVQKRTELQAHRRGMRISRVCAWNTSKLAFDGSGPVVRGVDMPYNVCVFQTGKQYNCDIGAAMNIGARYFLRAMDSIAPSTPRRTLSTLWEYHKLEF